MSSNLYNILSLIDSVCETYQENSRNNNENKQESKEENKDNITCIRNFLNVRNINNNYTNNRNILSNIVENTNVCNMISLFVTNYMNNGNNDNRNNDNDNRNNENNENNDNRNNENNDNRNNENNDNNDNSINLCIFYELDEEIRKKYESCSICFENFKENEIVNITRCIHIYHETCINEWLKRNKTCPLCRLNI